ncbi:hypothetical protein HanXRQr2_Chr07g0287851 [Helianthus annuus]|uniref:Uncharacterized protein n=1 Tax=Helianthus annuus TaxID=4232 RepID=A0A9K3IK02_HELAN|nr:hypothetical protein HanXRQr2_Chr07g0287851 [Helianthus annuus]
MYLINLILSIPFPTPRESHALIVRSLGIPCLGKSVNSPWFARLVIASSVNKWLGPLHTT